MPVKILFIVGAGASSEANLPTGDKLKYMIADFLDMQFDDMDSQISGDRLITEALRLYVKKKDKFSEGMNGQLINACCRIRDAMPQALSIDNFIDTHSDDKEIELCGKLAIVRSVLAAEQKSLLYVNNRTSEINKINYRSLDETWYSSFMKLLTDSCKKEDLIKRLESIALIVFNYDRCIEHFLYNSLQNYYGIQPEEAGKLVNGIKIYHPYGVVGRLPWQGGTSIEFGEKPQPSLLLELAGQIKTFTEGTDPSSSEINAIHDSVFEAATIVFLGFAFHKLNMELMSTSTRLPDTAVTTVYFGTAQGISSSDCSIIKSDLNKFKFSNHEEIHIDVYLDCARLFKEYWRRLSLN